MQTTSGAVPGWADRFRRAAPSVGSYALAEPTRCIFLWSSDDLSAVYAGSPGAQARRLPTPSGRGVLAAALDPTGVWVWSLSTDADRWYRQPWDGSGDPQPIGPLAELLTDVIPLPDGSALAAEVNPSYCRLLRMSEAVVQVLAFDDRPRVPLAMLSVEPLRFLVQTRSGTGQHEIQVLDDTAKCLAIHRVAADASVFPLVPNVPVVGRAALLIAGPSGTAVRLWDYMSNHSRDLSIALPGEIEARWDANQHRVIVLHQFQAAAELLELDLRTGDLRPLIPRQGWIADFVIRPDSTIDFRYSTSANPPVVAALPKTAPSAHPISDARSSVPARAHWVHGPGGPIHVLVSRPRGCAVGGVFLVHGGPAGQDPDAFSPEVAAWVDSGFTVFQANYRGSSGYGQSWLEANSADPGLTEVADLQAVRTWALTQRLASQGSLVLCGSSWGGYLSLLAAGARPRAWDCYIANRPIADYIAAYYEEPPWLQEIDTILFGGTPAERLDSYRRASPLTYVSNILRPTLVQAAANDERCPPGQVRRFERHCQDLGLPVTVVFREGGHAAQQCELQIEEIDEQVQFACREIEPR